MTNVNGAVVTLSNPVGEFVAGSAIEFLNGDGSIRSSYTITGRTATTVTVALANGETAANTANGVAYRGVWVFSQITMRGAPDSFAGEIYVVEPLGSETLVSVKVGADRVNVRVWSDFQGQIGDQCGVRPDASRTVLFETDSGQLIQGSTNGASKQPGTGSVRESA